MLATSPGSARWPLLYLTTDNDLSRAELVSGEVHLAAVGQLIPVMMTDLDVPLEDLAEDQLSAE